MQEWRMDFGKYGIAPWWQNHHKKVMAIGVVAWVVFITLVYHNVSARRDDGIVASILPVGGLPVT
jgi:hypothetical protein